MRRLKTAIFATSALATVALAGPAQATTFFQYRAGQYPDAKQSASAAGFAAEGQVSRLIGSPATFVAQDGTRGISCKRSGKLTVCTLRWRAVSTGRVVAAKATIQRHGRIVIPEAGGGQLIYKWYYLVKITQPR